ncbi:MAG: hypothetical protein K0R17_1796 [Rariglobus sp.]|jgi:hypothetical protein|nr:hypothetical protein [Rariglobus sp.]
MSCLGVHLALTDEEVDKLESLPSDAERLEYIQEDLEERYFSEHREFLAQSDKAWDAIHRALGNGDLSYTSGPDPLRFTILGGTPLYYGGDYIISLKLPLAVGAVAQALQSLTHEDFRKCYDAMDAGKYGFPKSDEDFEYTWRWLTEIRDFYQRAAEAERCVIFTADQ